MRARKRFDALALPHLPAVYRIARQLAANQADDLVQETFLRAWKHFDQFDPATNCRAWLFRILHNAWITQWRKTRLELPLPEADQVRTDPYYDWEGDFLREELSGDIQWALSRLPDQYRWAVLLADVEELTYQEIAATMECPIGTVMSRINRGRHMLERLLRSRRLDTEGAKPRALLRR
jgi:RNA polymerase sigma-70 factor (ECF subfamily)